LDKDYAFLIDSTKQSYRIVQHQNKTEKILVNWTKFSDIRSGTQSNEIEVRDENGRMAMYINGKYATSVTDSVNFKDGVAGVYAGDAIPIAFSNLQLSK
jgi:membrane protease subunit (stomatin/prohibitin family)